MSALTGKSAVPDYSLISCFDVRLKPPSGCSDRFSLNENNCQRTTHWTEYIQLSAPTEKATDLLLYKHGTSEPML